MLVSSPIHSEKFLASISTSILKSFPIIEVGCGNGHFLIEEATTYPENYFIGCDIKGSRVEKTQSKIKQSGITNAFVVQSRGEDLLSFFKNETLGGFYMNFPDPWWKKRYHKRRFFYIQQDIDNLVKKLKVGGFISFVSDHKEYFNHVLTLLSYNNFLQPLLSDGFIETKTFEYKTMFALKWEKEGRSFYKTQFIKKLPNIQN